MIYDIDRVLMGFIFCSISLGKRGMYIKSDLDPPTSMWMFVGVTSGTNQHLMGILHTTPLTGIRGV